jgi:predicted DCC family thiol-disulfide oxidoreductase YuxK
MGSADSVEKIILFDGVCNLCSASVQFVLRHNSKKDIRFASLQSDVGQKLLGKFLPSQEIKTIVFIRNGEVFVKSDAALELCKELNGLYPIFHVYKVVPKSIRDGIYNFIAQNRYRWFGKREECWMPTEELKDRFIS